MPLQKRRIRTWILLLLSALLIRLFALRRDWVETYYSSVFYPWISKFTRFLFGWIPFSVGDLLYFFVGTWLILQLFRGFQGARRIKSLGQSLKSGGLWILSAGLVLYISFNLLWGLNYNRLGIAWQMKLEIRDTTSSSLINMTALLRDHTNAWRPMDSSRYIFRNSRKEAFTAYAKLGNKISWLSYSQHSVKPSLFGVMGNYMGYSGYYNPFSGEAQLNTQVPGFLQPFSTCHEIAHQLGYAKENEANFVGYLAARESPDSSMRYSAYLNMFLYANNELKYMDTAQARQNFVQLSEPVKADLAAYRRYLIQYEGPVDQMVEAFYNQFLKLNQQPAGMRTYNKVVLWLLAFYQERGTI